MNRLSGRKTIIVTGGLGFIGSHFVEQILAMGHKVINIDSETYAANTYLTFTGDYHYFKQDIAKVTDLPFCDMIINFAAESHVDNSINNASNFLNSNVLGVHNLLELIKQRKIQNMMSSWGYRPPTFVQISTDEVFGDIIEGFFKEDDRHHPSNPYSATKSCAEQLVYAWGRTYELPYLITRTTNNYGARQHAEKLIPASITSMLTNKKVIVHGDGRYIRNWLHVEDNVNALITIIDKGDLNSSYHVSSDEEFSVKQIVTMIANLLNKSYEDSVDTSTDRSGCDERYALNCDKLLKLGWKQQRHLADELPKLIAYYEEKLSRK
jgi:dTDP-glucose 4,6-dehydratase